MFVGIEDCKNLKSKSTDYRYKKAKWLLMGNNYRRKEEVQTIRHKISYKEILYNLLEIANTS